MQDVTLTHAKEHLEELIERASRGEEVRIAAPAIGTVRLQVVSCDAARSSEHKRRRFGRLAGKIAVPEGLLDPMTQEELKEWYGDDP